MLKIQLWHDGEMKTYTQNFISGYMFRRALDLDLERAEFVQKFLGQNTVDQAMVEAQKKLLDNLFHFISEVFGGQFTAEEYERGTDALQIMDQSWAIVHGIINQTMEPLNGLTNPDDDTQKKKSNRRK